MVRVSNGVFVTINILSLLFGLSIVAYSGFVHFHRDHGPSECEKVLQTPLLTIGIFIVFVSIMGLVGSICRANIVLILYLIVMFCLIMGMIVFTLFVFIVTNKGAGKAVSGQGVSEYRLGDYSNWLRRHFVNGKNWDQIRSCLVEAQICASLGNDHNYRVDGKVEDFYKKNLSPIQSGCCKPPSECGFKYKNATFWIQPPEQEQQDVDNSDCDEWSNHQEKLCYNCNSCKGGVLANIRKKWRNLALFNIVVILVTISVYCVGCCAGRNNRDIYKIRV